MPKFNPDEFLKEDKEPAFDPDEFLKEDHVKEQERVEKRLAEPKDSDIFDPDAFLKKTEIITTPLEKKTSKRSRQDSLQALKAGLAGVSQGATAGFADEAYAAVDAALEVGVDRIMRLFTPEDQAKMIERPEYQTAYKEVRDETRRELNRLQKENPKAYMAGEVGGAIGGSLIPGTLAARGAGKLAQAAQAAAKATKSVPRAGKLVAGGATAGVGLSEEEDMAGIAKDAALGAVAGGALPAAGKAARWLGKLANSSQVKKLGLDAAKMKDMGADKVAELGKLARKHGVLTSNPKKTAANALKLEKEALDKLTSMDKVLEAQKVDIIDSKKLVKALSSPNVLGKYDNVRTEGIGNMIKGFIEKAGKLSPSDHKAAKALRNEVYEQALKEGKGTISGDALVDVWAVMRNNASDSLEAAGKKLKDPLLKEAWETARGEFHLATNIAQAAKQAAKGADKGLVEKGMDKVRELGTLRGLGKAGGKAALMSAAPLATATGLVGIAAARKFGPAGMSKLQRTLEKGGPTAVRLRDLLQKGNVDKAATLLLTEELVD